MRVLLDAFWWSKGPLANRTVLREVITEWATQFPEDELVLAVRSGDTLGKTDLPRGCRIVRTHLWPQAVVNALELPLLARRTRADVIFTHNYAPLLGRSVTFIHDLLFEDNPQWFSLKELVYFWPMGPLARRASAVLTSTETEARRIERLHPRLAPVGAVGLAVASELREADAHEVVGLTSFILSVGRLNARKNLGNAIRGAVASGLLSREYPLVVVGSSEFSGRSPDLPAEVRALVDAGSLVFLGRVSNGELRWLYERAGATVYMSLDEGFGLPPIEAAVFGCPVVVSERQVFRETVGPDAFFADPDDVESIASAIRSAVVAERRPNRTLQSAREYSWSKTVEAIRAAALGVTR